MRLSLIGIDIAKNVFQWHGVDYAGNVKFKFDAYSKLRSLPVCNIRIKK